MKAIILAGGKGTRLAPYTMVLPKPLVPVGDKPVLEIIIRQLAQHGFKEIILSVGHLAELIQAFFQNKANELSGISLTYVRENKLLGTAAPIASIPNLNETFLVMNGDVLTTLDYSKLVDFHREREAILTVAACKREIEIDLGVIEVEGRKIVNYSEKPTMNYLVSMGIYVYEPEILSYIEPGEYLDFPDLVMRLLQKRESVCVYKSEDYWLDIGRREDYEKAIKEFEERKNQFSVGERE